MTYNQYIKWKKCLSEEERKSYYQKAIYKNYIRNQEELLLPKSCLVRYDVSKMLSKANFEPNDFREKTKAKIEKFYNKNHSFPKPIIVSSNCFVFKGWCILYYAKLHRITEVIAVVLDNVVKLKKNKYQ